MRRMWTNAIFHCLGKTLRNESLYNHFAFHFQNQLMRNWEKPLSKLLWMERKGPVQNIVYLP